MNDRPLRIHFVLTSLPVGGAETLLLNLVRNLDRDNFAPEVVCLKEPGELGPEFARDVPLHSQLIQNKFDATVLLRLRRLFRKRAADAVITIGAGDKMFWGRLAARAAGVPVVCSALHSTGWPDGIGRLNRMLTPLTDGFIAVARNHAEHLIRYEGFPAERVWMIANGVDTQRFVPDSAMRKWLRDDLNLPREAPLVGIVAALRQEKNHAQFVAAGRQVLKRFPHSHFVVVGEGPERGPIEAEIGRAGLQSHFHLLGNRQDTHRILAALDVFCLTSKNEANPVSILEALSCAVPVVSPNVGSICETVLPERTGILTIPLDADDTARAIGQLLDDPARAAELGRNGRQLVEADWSLQSMVEGYQSLIERLYNIKAAQAGKKLWKRVKAQESERAFSQPAHLEGLDEPQVVSQVTGLALPMDYALPSVHTMGHR